MLGDSACHGPLLLMWSVVQQLLDPHATLTIKKLGNKAVELRAFTYLNSHLQHEPFSGKTVSWFRGLWGYMSCMPSCSYSAFSQVFNLHVLRSCSPSIFTPFSFMSFLITSLHLSFGLPIFRCPSTSTFSLRHLL